MRKTFRLLGLVFGLLLLAGAGFASYVAVRGVPRYGLPASTPDFHVTSSPARLAQGEKLVLADCADCHRNEASGKLSGQRLADVPTEFGQLSAANITQDREHGIGAWTDAQLVTLLRTGVGRDGRYRVIMPSFVHMSDEDVSSIVAFLRSDHPWVQPDPSPSAAQQPSFLLKALTNTVMKPTPAPTQPVLAPPATGAVAYGRYLVVGRYKCYDCHSADFATNNALEPEKSEGYLGGGNQLLNRQQQPVVTRNLTMDEDTGLGDWTAGQFAQAVRFGMSPHGALRYPMPKYSVMSEEEAGAIWAYLRTVPKIKNATPEDAQGGVTQ